MTRAVIADTGPLYAAADPDDAYHRRARRELQQLARENYEVLLAYPTLLEAYTLVLHRLGKRAASVWLSEILNGASLINLAPDDYHRAISKVRMFSDQAITLFDATVAVMAPRLRAKVWTYDHHFDIMRAPIWR